jgi:hypothetical protein
MVNNCMALSKDEVKKIQTGGIDWAGQPLKVDGIMGPKTAWWKGILSLDPKRQEVLRLALGYHATNMGEKTGRNDGDFVDMLFKPVDLQKRGYSWCVAYISHCYRECGVTWPKYHVSAWSVIDWAKENNRLVEEPMPSDIEVFLYPKVKGEDWQGHGRIITAYDPVTKRTAGVDGNVQNLVRVGYRDPRPNRYFVRPLGFTANHGTLMMPTGLIDLDGLADR